MRSFSHACSVADDDVFSVGEIARAANVAPDRVARLLSTDRRSSGVPFVGRRDAVRLVRALAAERRSTNERGPLTLVAEKRRAQAVPLAASGAMHLAMLLGILVLSSGWLGTRDTDQPIVQPQPHRLVFLLTPGPGGGGGGGGLKAPVPPSRAERRPRKPVQAVKTPVPAPRRTPPAPKPEPKREPPRPPEPPRIDPPRPEPPKVDPPKPEPTPIETVHAPVAPSGRDAADRAGVLESTAATTPSTGPGAGGGAGRGAGTGIGEGRGAGLGPGEGGGTGGGPFRPGAGIDPPTLLREVKPVYTDEARRRSLEGDVVLEVVVRRDGSVGNVRLVRRLGAGLDDRAVEAVRQWRFAPARRSGAPVDVIVEISVEFSLR